MVRRRRGRRRHKRDDLLVLVPATVLGYFLVTPTYGRFVYCLMVIAVVLLWISFVMPTLCGYDLGHRGCIREVYGKLNGCGQHGALKRDAMFAALRMRNPGQLVRIRWQDGSAPKGRTVGAAAAGSATTSAQRANTRRGRYDIAMLAFTVIGSLGTVLTIFLQK